MQEQQTTYDKIEEIVDHWLNTAILGVIYEYAGQRYCQWLNEQDETLINELHEEVYQHVHK